MSNNKKTFSMLIMIASVFAIFSVPAFCQESNVDEDLENMSAEEVAAYNIEGSLFEQITTLEQEKVLMQLEKERAQLDLELDRLAAEKIKLHMEIDSLSGRAEQQQQELQNAQAKLEAEAAKLEREKEALAAEADALANRTSSYNNSYSYEDSESENIVDIANDYRLVNVFGAGSQLQATIKNLNTGQDKRISVGKVVDGYTVKSISIDDGIVFVKDGQTQTLNVASNAK